MSRLPSSTRSDGGRSSVSAMLVGGKGSGLVSGTKPGPMYTRPHTTKSSVGSATVNEFKHEKPATRSSSMAQMLIGGDAAVRK
jgi:hypothetical protein